MTNFEEIYSLYFRDVYRFALKLSMDELAAEEITQETFYKALKGIESFNGKCKIKVWLCQIAKNTYFSLCSDQRRKEPLDELADIEDTKDLSIEERLINKSNSLELHRYIHEMEEPYKEVFTLRIFGDLSFTEIGRLFGKTESWARVTFFRAKNRLKEKLS